MGEQTIGSLAVGDTVLAYNPTTGKSEPEPVQRVWRNYDHDLVDVQLTTTSASGTTSGASTNADGAGSSAQQQASSTTTSRLHRWVRQGALAAGLAATLLTSTTGGASAQAAPTPPTTAPTRAASTTETIHTTANHPWLTSDRGWVHAGDLRPGEQVVTLPAASAASRTTDAMVSSSTATVAWVQAIR